MTITATFHDEYAGPTEMQLVAVKARGQKAWRWQTVNPDANISTNTSRGFKAYATQDAAVSAIIDEVRWSH